MTWPATTRHRLAASAAPALLALVALSQIALVQTEGLLTPAKGGGFGLFSTVDKLRNRVYRAYLEWDGGEYLIEVQGALPPSADEALAYPTDGHLRELSGLFVPIVHDQPVPVRLRLAVYRLEFSADGRVVRRRLVNELTLDGDDVGLD